MDGTCRVGPGVDIVYLKLVCNLFSLVCPQCPMAHFSVKQIWSASLIKLVGQRPAMMKTLTDLCQLAVTLLNLPSSSASIERIFSNFGIVQTKLRNRLGVEKAAKHVMCYRQLRGHAELDW